MFQDSSFLQRKSFGCGISARPHWAALVALIFPFVARPVFSATARKGATVAAKQKPALQGAVAVLQQTETSTPAKPATPHSDRLQELRKGIADLRKNVLTLPPEEAARSWIALVDTFSVLDKNDFMAGGRLRYAASVSFSELIAVLPPPSAWPALRQQIEARRPYAPKAPLRDLALALWVHTLVGDQVAQRKDIGLLTKRMSQQETSEYLSPASEYIRRLRLAYADTLAAAPSNSPGKLRLNVSVKKAAPLDVLLVPDLVTSEGATKASAKLRALLLTTTREIEVPLGDETGALARRIALQNVAALKVPQWKLAQSVEAIALYEALDKRFGSNAKRNISAPNKSWKASRQTAQSYYLLGLIASGRTSDAVALISRGAGRNALPLEGLDALQRAGRLREVEAFLRQTLTRNPQLPLWNQYISVAARTGNTAPMLALVRARTMRKGLAPARAIQLRTSLYQALLAADRISEGISVLRGLLAAVQNHAPGTNPSQSTELAARLMNIGHLMNRSDWLQEGVAAYEKSPALRASSGGDTPTWMSGNEYSNPAKVFRAAGLDAKAEKYLIGLVKRTSQNASTSLYAYSGERAASRPLTELAGIYLANHRYNDVVTLLDKAQGWGAKDLVQIYTLTDSAGVPLGYMAAKSLAATGHREEARPIARSIVEVWEGYDPGYQLLVDLEGADSLPVLERVAARNRFQERPLFWKAAVLLRAGKLPEAEAAARAAIAIDPSDGESGKGDRMRAYSVLADTLAARGETAQANQYRGAVKAIRLSENADDFYEAGLLKRAVAMYARSLGYFSDAYCVQSRLALRLVELGRVDEAEAHYRRAYELMPQSFGRVESHCFGCEGVFQGAKASSTAESVFRRLLAQNPRKPQLHYLMGYLRDDQERYREALVSYRRAVQLDPDYLNAWSRLLGLGEHIQLAPAERLQATRNLLRLDPEMRNGQYDISGVSDFHLLWNTYAKIIANYPDVPATLYPLKSSVVGAEQWEASIKKALQDAGLEGSEYANSLTNYNMSPETDARPGGTRRDHYLPGDYLARQSRLLAISQIMDMKMQEQMMRGVLVPD